MFSQLLDKLFKFYVFCVSFFACWWKLCLTFVCCAPWSHFGNLFSILVKQQQDPYQYLLKILNVLACSRWIWRIKLCTKREVMFTLIPTGIQQTAQSTNLKFKPLRIPLGVQWFLADFSFKYLSAKFHLTKENYTCSDKVHNHTFMNSYLIHELGLNCFRLATVIINSLSKLLHASLFFITLSILLSQLLFCSNNYESASKSTSKSIFHKTNTPSISNSRTRVIILREGFDTDK